MNIEEIKIKVEKHQAISYEEEVFYLINEKGYSKEDAEMIVSKSYEDIIEEN